METRKERQGMYAKIAIARKQLPLMDEEAYRDLLDNEFGTRSAAQLSKVQLARLLHLFAKMGVHYSSKGSNKNVLVMARPDWIEISDNAPFAQEKRQIVAIWRKLGYSMSSLETRVQRAFGAPTLLWLNDGKKVSVLLSDLQRREKAFNIKQAARA